MLSSSYKQDIIWPDATGLDASALIPVRLPTSAAFAVVARRHHSQIVFTTNAHNHKCCAATIYNILAMYCAVVAFAVYTHMHARARKSHTITLTQSCNKFAQSSGQSLQILFLFCFYALIQLHSTSWAARCNRQPNPPSPSWTWARCCSTVRAKAKRPPYGI